MGARGQCAICGGWDESQDGYDGDLHGSVFSVDRSYYASVECFCPACTRKVEKAIAELAENTWSDEV